MSLLGKVLVFLNVLAAAGFVYLAATDYATRQVWSYGVFRHELALSGLPLDEKEAGADGVPRVQDLTDATLKDAFAQAGGNPVKTQTAELDRVRNALRSKVDDGTPLEVPDPVQAGKLQLATPAQKLAWFLIPLAPTAAQRDALLAGLRDPKLLNADELGKQFDNAFSSALAKPDPDDKKRAIAELLFRLNDVLPEAQAAGNAPPDMIETPSYKRFVVVVGAVAAAKAVDDQALRLEALAREAERGIGRDRLAFVAEHRRLLGRVEALAQEVQAQQAALAGVQEQVETQQRLVNERDKQVKDLEARLASARKETQRRLDEQRAMQQTFFEAQLRLRNLNGENQQLERDIREREMKQR